MNNERTDDEMTLINETLALLLEAGKVTVEINEDGERVFKLAEDK